MKAPREAWIACGFELLVTQGPTAVKVDYLCKAMKLSKGAFYHHFGHLAGYQSALLDSWEQAHTEAIIAAVSQLEDNAARRELLTSMANGKDQKLENALRAWAIYSPDVARRLNGVDERRIDFIRQLLEVDAAPGVDARIAAQVVYAHFVGWQQMHETLTEQDFADMEALLKRVLLA